ncbi:MAG: hypothetical protein JOZ65_34080 [Chloroflexi bacterium]|nr:hypothetical protein [Chloroflexota bacterium]
MQGELRWFPLDRALGLIDLARSEWEAASGHLSMAVETSHCSSSSGRRPIWIERDGSSRGHHLGPQFHGGLTAREVRVLRPVAAGKSNRQTARDVGPSDNTVANHLTSIPGQA